METEPDETPSEGGASGGTQPDEREPAEPWPDQEQRDPNGRDREAGHTATQPGAPQGMAVVARERS